MVGTVIVPGGPIEISPEEAESAYLAIAGGTLAETGTTADERIEYAVTDENLWTNDGNTRWKRLQCAKRDEGSSIKSVCDASTRSETHTSHFKILTRSNGDRQVVQHGTAGNTAEDHKNTVHYVDPKTTATGRKAPLATECRSLAEWQMGAYIDIESNSNGDPVRVVFLGEDDVEESEDTSAPTPSS